MFYSNDQPLICCGDLNVAREEIDVHNPKRLLGHVDFNPEVWEAFDRLKAWGFVRRLQKVSCPRARTVYLLRLPRTRVGGERHWLEVDHILATPVLAEKSVNAYIDMEARRAEKPSDHTRARCRIRE